MRTEHELGEVRDRPPIRRAKEDDDLEKDREGVEGPRGKGS